MTTKRTQPGVRRPTTSAQYVIYSERKVIGFGEYLTKRDGWSPKLKDARRFEQHVVDQAASERCFNAVRTLVLRVHGGSLDPVTEFGCGGSRRTL
jgi:hypothetical protein